MVADAVEALPVALGLAGLAVVASLMPIAASSRLLGPPVSLLLIRAELLIALGAYLLPCLTSDACDDDDCVPLLLLP